MPRHREITNARNTAFEGIDPDLKIIDDEADAKRWEGLNKKGEALTKETYESWTGELHNLLIFAGLFSAIITAFTIEANKTIQGEPIVMAVLLLQTIVLQLNNQSNPQANLPINLYPETEPSLYSQRINVLYSVSLALSLVAVLGGILCLQWLREFGKNITGVSHKEDLLLQHQRHESLQTWGVLVILNMLPLFLLTALGFFFVGFMVSQWGSKSFASIPVTFLVALCGGFVACTTVLPTCQFLFLVGKSTGANDPRPILCPYRSPQSWLFHLILQKIFLITNLPLLKLKVQSDFWKALKGISRWLDYDINGVKRWKENAGAVEVINESLLWISREYRQATTVTLDAYYCMVFASCYRARMKLKESNASVDLEQDWEEHELSTFFKVKNNIQQDVIKWKWNEGNLRVLLGEKNNIQRDSDIKWEWEERDLLTFFQTKNNLNGTEVIQKIHAKVVIDATVDWHRSVVLLECPVPLSDISALGKSISDEFDMGYESSIYLLNDITTALQNSENTSVTPEYAVAVACHVIDTYSWCDETIPILEELCKRPTTQLLLHIRHLCNKLRDKLSSEHECDYLVVIFNDVFRSVDSAHYKDLAPILGRLLVKCDECFFDSPCTRPFLEIIEDLISRRLIGKEHALDNIFLYTKHIIQHSHVISDILPSIATTLNAILSAVEEHDDRPRSSKSPSCYVIDPNNFTIPHTLPHPDQDEDLESVWSLIDNFNKRLPKEVWGSSLIQKHVKDATKASEDLHDKKRHEVTSEILTTEDLPVIAFAIPKALKSSQLEIPPDIGTGTATHGTLLSSAQDSKHQSSNNCDIPIDPSAEDEIPLVQSKMIGDSKIKNSSGSGQLSSFPDETSTSLDPHLIAHPLTYDGVGTVNQASVVVSQGPQTASSTQSSPTDSDTEENGQIP